MYTTNKICNKLANSSQIFSSNYFNRFLFSNSLRKFSMNKKSSNSTFFLRYNNKSFSDTNYSDSKKEELKNLKAALNQDKKSFLERVSNYFGYNKTTIVNHTKRDLNLEEIQAEINKLKKEDEKTISENSKEDQKKLDEFFKIQKKFISKQALDENYMDKAIEILRGLNSIENLFNDKRYNMFKDDLLFLTNTCNDPKIICKMVNFSFIFMKEDKLGKTFSDFSHNLAEKSRILLESTELNELLILVNFFTSLRNLNLISIINLYEPFKNEIFRRLDKEFFLKSRMKNPFIENDEIIKILLVFNEGKLLDESLVNKIIQYIFDNIENFGIKEILEISLFFIDKKEFSIPFQNFFNRGNVIKLKRNIKNMTLESLYDYSFIYSKLEKFKTEENVLNSILEALLKSQSENGEISSIYLFEKSSPKTVTKFVKLLEKEFNNTKNEKMMKSFFSKVSEYFVLNNKKFEIEESLLLINILKSKKMIDEEILKKVLNNFYSSMNKNDEKNLIKLCNMYLTNPEIEFNQRSVKEFETIFRNSSNLNVCAEIFFMFVRREHKFNLTKSKNISDNSNEQNDQNEFSFLKEENFQLILDKYETIHNLNPSKNLQLDIRNKIKLLWSLSYFYIPPLDKTIKNENLFENKIVEDLMQNIILTKSSDLNLLNIYEILILIHSCRNLSKSKKKSFDPIFSEKICELLKNVENLVIKHLREFTLIEFLAVFDIYTSKKIASHNLIEAFSELVLQSIEQFSLIHLEILIKGMENVISYITNEEKEKLKDERFEKNPFDIVNILRMLKIKLETRVLEKSTEEVSDNLIREVVKDFLKKEKETKFANAGKKVDFKKLI